MKILHISDLHIGLKLINHDLSEDQIYILNKIISAAKAEKPNAILIAGDIYDKAIPSAEAVDIFNNFISQLSFAVPECEIMIISGNHDSSTRIDLFRSVLKKQKIHMIGMPPTNPKQHIEKITLNDEYGEVNFYLLPFVKPSMVKAIVGTDNNGNNLSYNDTIHRLIERENIDTSKRNVLVSHQFYLPTGSNADDIDRTDSEIRTVGNIDEVKGDILTLFDYAALGHIHKPMKVGSEFYCYCGTPLACSVSEAGQGKGIVVAELSEKGKCSTSVIPLKPLREVKVICDTFENALKHACDDYVSIILTDKIDLDVFDMQDRLRAAFPHLLEIRRDNIRRADYNTHISQDAELEPFELCCSFLKSIDADEKDLLRDVINTVLEAK